jgi:hypothetical protein
MFHRFAGFAPHFVEYPNLLGKIGEKMVVARDG